MIRRLIFSSSSNCSFLQVRSRRKEEEEEEEEEEERKGKF